MNKTELVKAVAEKTGFTGKDVTVMLDALTKTVVDEVANGGNVQLIGFGTFESTVRAAREGKNPHTGEAIKIPETIVPKFKPGKGFKDAVKKD